MSGLESLTDTQKLALTQLQSLTNGGDIDVEIAILESVSWDVQVGDHFSTTQTEFFDIELLFSESCRGNIWKHFQ